MNPIINKYIAHYGRKCFDTINYLYSSATKYFDYNNFFNSYFYYKLPDEYKSILNKYGYKNFTGDVSQFLSFLNDTDVFLNMVETKDQYFIFHSLITYLEKNNYEYEIYEGNKIYNSATDCPSVKEFAAKSNLDLYSNKSINNFF